jgi:RimJ/RimL family protein N-acetyltransferase
MKQSTAAPMEGSVLLREVREGDLPLLFEHQRDSVANEMAAFPAREKEAFMVHWGRILGDEGVIKRTILFGADMAGNILCWEQSGRLLIGYWIGRQFWGKGIASTALSVFVTQVRARPLHAHVAKHNVASIRVLEKCGFRLSGEEYAASLAGGEAVEEFIFTLAE